PRRTRCSRPRRAARRAREGGSRGCPKTPSAARRRRGPSPPQAGRPAACAAASPAPGTWRQRTAPRRRRARGGPALTRRGDREEPTVEVGAPAPDSTLKDQEGEDVPLSSSRGRRNVVLMFFPLAFSGVCTRQLTSVGRQEDRYGDADAV